VLDLVFMVRAGDGEMGGDGESSPAIMGIDRVGGPMLWLVVQREGLVTFRVFGTGGFVLSVSAVGPVSSPCCDLVLRLLVLLDSSEGGTVVGIMVLALGRVVSAPGMVRWLVYIYSFAGSGWASVVCLVGVCMAVVPRLYPSGPVSCSLISPRRGGPSVGAPLDFVRLATQSCLSDSLVCVLSVLFN
jgi:hypothetical protein